MSTTKKHSDILPDPKTCLMLLEICPKEIDGESPKCGNAMLILSDLIKHAKQAGNEKLIENLRHIINSCGNAFYGANDPKHQYSCKESIETYNRIKDELKQYQIGNAVTSPGEPMPGVGD